MKPLKIKLTAFGPYKTTEVINFQELDDHNLFVISGNTGSGKTTIFDGICFALYGSASGQDRENQTMLRSDFADDDTHTAVELTFALNDRVYRVLRQLGHVKKGNKSKTGERYEFYEQMDGKEVPSVDRQIVSEINQKIESLIGLTQDQFKQIVMLPQGEFRKLLTSETENKEQILRRLFKTESYQQISEQLRIRKSKIEEVFMRENQLRENYIQQLHGTLPEREGSELFKVLSEDHFNNNQLLAGLEAEIAYYEKQVVVDQRKYEDAYEAHHKQQISFHRSQAINERFAELTKKEAHLQQLIEQESDFLNKEKQLKAAERAHQIVAYEEQVNDTLENKNKKSTLLKQTELAYTRAEENLTKWKVAYERGEKEQKLREDIGKKLDRLQEYLPTVQEINTIEKKLAVEKEQLKLAFGQLTEQREVFQKNKASVKTNYQKLQSLEERIGILPEKQEKLTSMREQALLLKNYLTLKQQLNTLKENYKVEKEKLLSVQIHYKNQEQMWLDNQASILAHHLHAGESCPVCGSIEHPQKATSRKDLISREQLEKIKKNVDQQDEIYRNIRADAQAKQKQLREKEQEITQNNLSVDAAASTMEQLIVTGKQLREEVDQLVETRKKLTTIRETYKKETEADEQLAKKVHTLEEAYHKQKTTYEKNSAIFTERLRVVPEEVRSLATLEQEIAETKKLQNELETKWKEITENYQQARENKATAATHLTNEQKQLEEATIKYNETMESFQKALQRASFASVKDYKQAKMSEHARTEMKTAIEQYNQTLSMVKEQVKALKDQLKDEKIIDLTVMTEALKKLKNAYEIALNKWNVSKEYFSAAQQFKKTITKTNENVQKAEKHLSVITDLYDVVRGQNSKKVSFERYLQIEYLERIIDAANQRLKVLSNGQFFLMRSDRQESHGRQSGLALDVYDAYTGQTRDVKTLSGGEKFNASLCLALGMSDVIQSFQGNISIETMFIDEGFGSLDEESLNKSIETLIDLQASGRMIGVISHVQELKTIFPAILEVTKTNEGHSQTRFIVK